MGLPLAITATGMVTGVGLSAPASCAAMRCAIDNFQETCFKDRIGEQILGCEVPMDKPWRGRAKQIQMACAAIKEVLQSNPLVKPSDTPLLLCLSEPNRPGRVIDDDTRLFEDLLDELGFDFSNQSLVIPAGRVSLAIALKQARKMIGSMGVTHVLVAASDTMLVGETLDFYESKDRLLTSTNSNGFLPGEAGAALLLESGNNKPAGTLYCEGLGLAVEKSHIESEEPLKAEGLAAAIVESLEDAALSESELNFKITDIAGEQYSFKEASLAFSRIDRTHREEFDIWHPADCIGEVGAAIGLVMPAVLKAACEKNYAKGTVILAHCGNDDGRRASMIFIWR
jgi:3-oxoacyl-[acyl-carrier-protein] synthase-1